jgi:hypothetical protein
MTIMMNFFRTALKMPLPWVAWLSLLLTVNMVLPLFFMATLEARVVLATMMASAGLMLFLFAQKGFVRLLGVGHVLWIPLLYWLFGRVDFAAPDTGFEQWVLAVILLNGLSLVIDAVDVVRYLKGERQPTVTLPS